MGQVVGLIGGILSRECHAVSDPLARGKRLQALLRFEIPQPDRGGRNAGQQLALGMKAKADHGIGMAGECGDRGAAGNIPDLDRLVSTRGRDGFSVRTDGDVGHGGTMWQAADGGTCGCVPDTYGVVGCSADQQGIVMDEAVDGGSVAGKGTHFGVVSQCPLANRVVGGGGEEMRRVTVEGDGGDG